MATLGPAGLLIQHLQPGLAGLLFQREPTPFAQLFCHERTS